MTLEDDKKLVIEKLEDLEKSLDYICYNINNIVKDIKDTKSDIEYYKKIEVIDDTIRHLLNGGNQNE